MNSEFYDRSRAFAAIVNASGGKPLRILLAASDDCAVTPTGQLILAALCDILPRISERYCNIDVSVPTTPALFSPSIRTNFHEYLLARLNTVCPWGTFNSVQNPRQRYEFCVAIGPLHWTVCAETIYAYARGWRTLLSCNGSAVDFSPANFNPFSCLATASLIATRIYSQAEGILPATYFPKERERFERWSLFDFKCSDDDGPPLPSELDIGQVVQAGVGGTGQALLWALRYGPKLRGDWFAFEHEYLDVTNGNRYPLMAYRDIDLSKLVVAHREFQPWHSRLRFAGAQGKIDDVYRPIPGAGLMLATVDDEATRVQLQRWNTDTILNVGTQSQYLSVSRHNVPEIFAGAACVNCLYQDSGRPERRRREATVSFVTAMVGAVLGAEMIKHFVFPEACLRFQWFADIFFPQLAIPRQPTKFDDCPTCSKLRREKCDGKEHPRNAA